MTALVKRERSARWPAWFTRGLPEWFLSLDLPELDEWRDRDAMRLEESNEDGTLVVKAEIPGVDPERDVEITIEEGALTISAKREESHEERDEAKGTYRSEFRYGHFVRRIPLPAGTTDEDVKATYANGILEVRMPMKDAPALGKKIPIVQG